MFDSITIKPHTMKRQLLNTLSGTFLACLIIFCSCGSKKARMDTATFDKAFESAPADVKALAAKASKAFKEGKLEAGATTLAEISQKSGLTDAQKDGMRDVIIVVQKIMSEDADKSDMKVYQALEIATATLEGRPATRAGFKP